MADESVDFQTTVVATPPANTKVAVDTIAGVSYQRVKLDGGGDGLLVPIAAGRQADAASLPTALSTEDVAILGALTETAPATDTASSGLNGRLQRIAQRLTTLIALVPAALTGSGNFKVSLQESNASQAVTVPTDPFGANADAASVTGSISAKLRYLASLIPTALVGGKFSVTTASTITPTWAATTTAVLTPQMLAKGAVLQATFAVTTLKGGYLKWRIFRSGATAIDVAIEVVIRRVTGDSPAKYGDAWYVYTCGKTTAVAGVAAGSGNNAGVATLTLNAAKTFAAGPNGFIQLGVIDNTTTPTTASEFLRQAFATSTTAKLLEFPTQSAHNSTSHVVCDQAEAGAPWLDGGETYSISINYGQATTGDSVYVDAYLNPYNSDGAS